MANTSNGLNPDNFLGMPSQSQPQNALFQQMLEQTPSGSLLLRFDSKSKSDLVWIVSINETAERLLALDGLEIIGDSLTRIAPGLYDKLAGILLAAKNGVTIKGEQIQWGTPEKGLKPSEKKVLQISAFPIGIDHCHLVLENISERKNIETLLRKKVSQLEQNYNELEDFAYLVSHDLQEPVRNLISFSGLLKRQYEDKLDANALEYLHFICDAGSRMNRLIKDLLDFSRIGKEMEPEPIDCNQLLKIIQRDLEAQISETGTQIRISPLPILTVYPTEVRLLFQNLISNAIKFRKPDVKPQIRIEAERLPGGWKFCISDNGIGIDPSYLKKIFMVFTRLHSFEDYEGTGIGLAHCQKIVELHQGEIWVESTLGIGSKFYFTIPDVI